MAADEKWYFTKEQLANTPSRKCGIDADKELSYRQQAANFIQDMGQRLVVSQLCINTAIVYMHRFYVFHSLSQFHRNSIAAAALFLAAKVEEQPRKLEHVIKVAHMCLHRDTPPLDTKSEQYLEQAQDLVFNENVLLQTLGFDVAIDHPHTHVVRCCHLVKASKDLAQTSYFMASNSLHLTTMCLQYKPTVVACFCIHLACKWSNWEIPQSNEGKYWFWYVDKTVTSELLGQLTGEFLHIFDKCPSRLKRKIRSISANQSPNMNHPAVSNSPFDAEPRKVQSPANADGSLSFQSSRPFHPDTKSETDSGKRSSSSMSGRSSVDYREYREKKERAEREREKASAVSHSSSNVSLNADPSKHHSHHHKQSSSSANVPNKHSSSSSSSSSMKQNVHHNHHHSSRQDIKSSSQMLPQRHSTGSSSGSNQPRDPNRDRQRMPREYNSSSNTSGGTVFSHHTLDNSLESTLNNISQDSSTVHPPEKLSNNVHKPHDGRGNDLRHGSKPQQPQQQKDAKPYSKYPDAVSAVSRSSSSSASSSKKPDILEQRSEEVRKLIEKPLPPPKPRAEVLKEEYAAMMLKQSHHPSKYGHQSEKPLPNANSTHSSESKMLSVNQTAFSVEKSPSAPVSASQISQKSLPISKSSSLPVKNGSSSSTSTSLGLSNNLDDVKTDKKPRGYLTTPVGDSDNIGLQNPPPPPTKHRSLFSPEKTPTPTPASSRESSHSRALKQKQRSSPAVPKQDMPSFTSPNAMQLTPELPHLKSQRLSNNVNTTSTSSQKQHRVQSNANATSLDQESKQQLEMLDAHSRRFISSFDLHELSSGFPDLMQSVKDNKSVVDVKPPLELVKPFENTNQLLISKDNKSVADVKSSMELVKPFENTNQSLMSNQRHKSQQSQQQQHHGLNNGIDGISVKQEYSTIDPSSFCLIKPELPDELLSNEMSPDFMFMKQEPKLGDFLSFHDKMPGMKQDSFSPLKSAQSINALLQEPLALMPSLLHDQHQQTREDDKSSLQMQQQQQQQIPPEIPLPSTVDMSDLTGPVQCTVDIPVTTATAPIVPVEPAPLVSTAPMTQDDKKSEHRSKSEKKKKEKKHKHKEKDKSKDKHKHKHKDKDKEKEKHHRDRSDREKDNKTEEGNGSATSGNPSLGAVPIKITIPKDKLNLSSDSIGTSSSSTTSSSLKIKIPKERLKVNEVSHQQQPQMQMQLQNIPPQQAPLKIKIRTDALARSTSDLQENNSRKREREMMESPLGAPPAKKQQQMQMQQRPNERQNGRHNSYGPGSTDKVRGGGRGAGPRLPQYPYQRYSLQQMREAGYRPYQQQRQSPPPPAFLRHPRPPPHPFFANYPPAMQAPPVFGYTAPGMFDPAMYYQYQMQQQEYVAAMYPQSAAGMMMTADGQIDTSIPPPSLPSGNRQQQQQQRLVPGSENFVSDSTVAAVLQPPPPPLPSGPPPSSSPPPPPPPE